MRKKTIGMILILHILFFLFIPFFSIKAYAAPVVGSNALKSVIVGAMEKGGIKFKNASARERAVDAWNMKAYEKWKADEAAGRNKDLWDAFETYRLNPPVPEPIPDKPGFGRILLDATIYGMAFGIGWDIGTEIYNAFINDTPTKYMSTDFTTIKDIPNLDLNLTLGLYKETVNREWGSYQHVWTSSYSELNTPKKFTVYVYSKSAEIGEFILTGISEYDKNNYELTYKEIKFENGSTIITGPYTFLEPKNRIEPLIADGYKYKHKPVANEIPDIAVPEPLKEVVNDPYAMPTKEPIEIVVPIGDNPFADNPYNNPDDWTNPNPEPEPNPNPEPEPNPNEPNPENPKDDWGKKFSQLVTRQFPFSLPWDLYYILKFLNAEPKTPVFKVDTKVFGMPFKFETDLHEFDGIAPFVRVFITLGFCLMLILITRKIMGGGV